MAKVGSREKQFESALSFPLICPRPLLSMQKRKPDWKTTANHFKKLYIYGMCTFQSKLFPLREQTGWQSRYQSIRIEAHHDAASASPSFCSFLCWFIQLEHKCEAGQKKCFVSPADYQRSVRRMFSFVSLGQSCTKQTNQCEICSILFGKAVIAPVNSAIAETGVSTCPTLVLLLAAFLLHAS